MGSQEHRANIRRICRSEKKREEGAYYTPRHLAETAFHVALEGRYTEAISWRVLDPACGSGIFLVAMFNLLAEQWLRHNSTHRRQIKAQAMLDIRQKQIRSVDLNADACRIAAFSLYLALFEKLKPHPLASSSAMSKQTQLWNTWSPMRLQS